MAGETPPPMPPTGEFSTEDYDFDALDELDEGNAFLDEVLTRAGEFALDAIEFVQEHPVLSGAIVAAGFGTAAGLVAAALVPRRRPPTAQEQAAATAAEATARAAEMLAAARIGSRLADAQDVLGSRLSFARGRLGRAAETANERVREAGLLDSLSTLGGRARDRARLAAADVAAANADDGAGLGDAVASKTRRLAYIAQLFPIAMALLRNPIVRDLLAQVLVNRLRRSARV
ncbi:MAG TPA: hypothetical protein VK066_07620 [Chloroflexota bacterium]|nr:hypothetical protein [Chloroflexota bacterium]